MDVFTFRDGVVGDYADYVRSFVTIREDRVSRYVHDQMQAGVLWPQPLIQLNPAFEPAPPLERLVAEGILHPHCLSTFASRDPATGTTRPFRLHRHQVDGILAARAGHNYVLTTGTGSGKSLAYIAPIVDHVLRRGSGRGIQAIVVYPMNALANSQLGELGKFLGDGTSGVPPVTFQRYTGQESEDERLQIQQTPPDILLTNYVMLELILTRPKDKRLIESARDLRFLVFDELHTYRGRQGADVAMLIRRVRDACGSPDIIHVGTSATMSSGGTWEDQRAAVADVATRLFGADVPPANVIGETLRRATPERADDADAHTELRARLLDETPPIDTAAGVLADPLASWIESRLGIRREPESGRLVRSTPRALEGEDGLATELSAATDVPYERCLTALQATLMAGYQAHDEHDRPIFAFRLHQFISKGESVYASPEYEATRHITLQGQQFVPDSERRRALLPLAFCRECGQDYYVVRRSPPSSGPVVYLPREISDRHPDDRSEPGFLYISTATAWPAPDEEAAIAARVPDDWTELFHGRHRLKPSHRPRAPRRLHLSPLGQEGQGDTVAHWIPAPFRFCLHCGVTYSAHQQSDYGKLATLGTEGRSTATSVLTLAAIRRLRRTQTLSPRARKLLSFTDNRQDASLQAGHFNDFVEIGLLRSAVWRATVDAGALGIRHDDLTLRVFDAMALPMAKYAANPEVRFEQRNETDRALRDVLGYYLYRDLRRGWRITSPNLEQCGLLRIDYTSLDEVASAEDLWASANPLIAAASVSTRAAIARVLLDHLRRELAIRVEYLEAERQERIQLNSNQYLVAPWAVDDPERFERATMAVARGRSGQGERGYVYLSPRGGFARFVRRALLANASPGTSLSAEDLEGVITHLLGALEIGGLVHRVRDDTLPTDGRGDGVAPVPGYRLNASAMRWVAGDGESAFHDPVRHPNVPVEGLRTNPFFTDFYRADTSDLRDLEAREHTAQVPGDIRERREQQFREARLPILYCSPTMELGVDIAELNVVNMRNVPPTPANYAQRSGRAGRSGQPAFVFTYCSAGSPHDQYFFSRPALMVAGAVTTPRLDLSNEDLLRAHVHAVWLRESGLDLKRTLNDLLDTSRPDERLPLRHHVQEALADHRARERALLRAYESLGPAISELVAPDGDASEWLRRVLDQVPHSFERACDRWRSLYLSALAQINRQHLFMLDPTRSPQDRETARRLRGEAESQRNLLIDAQDAGRSDFYSYRYFASEGFLPGYNFPRLPLSAYLPGRRAGKGEDDFLSRPRFLAISEFGPRSFIYHEGSRYLINKVILPVERDNDSLLERAARCEHCGFMHPAVGDEPTPDLCVHCNTQLGRAEPNLFRMQNVATRRRDRINSDEEERFRLGYDIRTGIRFATRGGHLSMQQARLDDAEGAPLLHLTYGHSATLWRINEGWRRRKVKEEKGFILDVERGFWARTDTGPDEDPEDPNSPRLERVIPYVEDTRNCLIIRPARDLDAAQMASLEAALKTALQLEYQLEDRELGTEPLPDRGERRAILVYEASEGGAGVLRRLVEEPDALTQIARVALELVHFDPTTGADRHRSPRARENCVAACYDCLLSYYNQRDHELLDRHTLLPVLTPWLSGRVHTSPRPIPREEHVARLTRLTDSELERRWLRQVDTLGLRLPDAAQVTLPNLQTRPDFLYQQHMIAIFIDGPHHDAADQRARDIAQEDALVDAGWTPVRFRHDEPWEPVFEAHRGTFGESIVAAPVFGPQASPEPFDPEDYDPAFVPLLTALIDDGYTVDPGGDILEGGTVAGAYAATVTRGGVELRLVDARLADAPDVIRALQASSERAHDLDPTAPDALANLRAALGGTP